METSAGDAQSPFKRMPLRVTANGKDHTVLLLSEGLQKGIKEFQILLDGIPRTLVLKEGCWGFSDGTENGLARAIWNTLSLRYRV